MRKLLMTFVALAFLPAVAATSAQAAARWTCEGPEYVCGSQSATKSSFDASEPKSPRATKAAKARNQQIVSAPSDDERPARAAKNRTKSYDNDGGSTYSGKASYYWQPQALASGGRFNPNAMTAAHKTLPFGTRVRVTNQNNGQSVVVVINDRGPYIAGRIIDLSKAAAHSINMQGSGVVPVSVQVLGRG